MSTLGKVNDATAFVLLVWAQGTRKWWMGRKNFCFRILGNKLWDLPEKKYHRVGRVGTFVL